MKKRHLVVGILAVLSVITFLDRMAIAVTGPAIQRELSIDPVAWGWVLSAYVLAYSAFEIPSGALGDRHGHDEPLLVGTPGYARGDEAEVGVGDVRDEERDHR